MSGVEDCFYHEAIATGNATSKEKQRTPAISQIPGWGSDVTAAAVPSFGGRRIGLFEHDSDYVRLAKMGGRANLLTHPDSAKMVPRERVAYSKPDWMVYEAFQPSPSRVKANVIPDYMIHDRPVPSHLPGGGNPPWAEDGQSCFRREGEDSVRSYKTTRIDNISKPGQKRLEANNNGGNDDGNYDNEIIESRKEKYKNRRYQAEVRLGEIEADFREARRGREEAAAAAATAAAADTSVSAEAAATNSEGYSPSAPSAPQRHSRSPTESAPEIGMRF